MEKICVAVDAMGGDEGLSPVIQAVRAVMAETPNLGIILVGNEREIKKHLAGGEDPADRLRIIHADVSIGMEDNPLGNLRDWRRRSSMAIALQQVKENHAQACVSAGNTGALTALSYMILKTLPGIDRPALCTLFPNSKSGSCYMLDLGANSKATPRHLLQFAMMGTILSRSLRQVPHPRVGLLNIGTEEHKGNDLTIEADRLLRASELNYSGFVEGHDLYVGDCDVVVCDGFVGNVALKASEGTARLIRSMAKRAFTKSLYGRFVSVLCLPILRGLLKDYDPRNYNGASLLGLAGVVVKSHGRTDHIAFANALKVAVDEARRDIPKTIERSLPLLSKQAAKSARSEAA